MNDTADVHLSRDQRERLSVDNPFSSAVLKSSSNFAIGAVSPVGAVVSATPSTLWRGDRLAKGINAETVATRQEFALG